LTGDLVTGSRILGDCLLESLVPAFHTPDASLLCIPGSGHGGWAWRFWLPLFAQAGYGGHALSFPNHGEAPSMEMERYCALTIDDYVARVVQIAAVLPKPLVLIGHSLGGIVAQLAAQRIESAALVLVASSGPRQLGLRRGELFPADQPVVFAPDVVGPRWFTDAAPEIMAWALARLAPESPGVLNGSGGRAEVDPSLIRCPVLVVEAGRDASSIPSQAELAALYGGDLLLFPEAGHDIMLERTALRAARGVLGWLDRNLPIQSRHPHAGYPIT